MVNTILAGPERYRNAGGCLCWRISVRNDRKQIMDQLKLLLKENASEDDVKRAEEKVQELTNNFIKNIDDVLEKKEEEIMTV